MRLLANLVLWTLALLHQGAEGTSGTIRKRWTKLHPEDFPSGGSVGTRNVQDSLICSMAALGVGTCRIFCFNYAVENCVLYETKMRLKPHCTENCQSGDVVCFHKVPPDGVFLGNGTTPIILDGEDGGSIEALNIYDTPMEHRWHFSTSPGYILQIKIKFFNFGSCGCGCNSVSFRDLNTSAVIDGLCYLTSVSDGDVNSTTTERSVISPVIDG
ncbi:uncharacterized protein LOC135218135 [Macrobrachium nipponense]|uniref:uncharacterized protein LOC135218135 n=1 Tax=Macrobrachium nipponense TaxID=159736 RepID=UPI0030C85F0E